MSGQQNNDLLFSGLIINDNLNEFEFPIEFIFNEKEFHF